MTADWTAWRTVANSVSTTAEPTDWTMAETKVASRAVMKAEWKGARMVVMRAAWMVERRVTMSVVHSVE